jgi:molybdopterin converting factor small subunit
MIKVKGLLFGTSRRLDDEASGATVGEVLRSIAERHPELEKHLFTAEGRLRNIVNVYVNDEDARFIGGLDAVLNPDDEILIVPAIAGGPGTNIDIEGELHRDAEIQIFVFDRSPSEHALLRLQAQATKFMVTCGFTQSYEYPAEWGSWFKRLLFSSRQPLSAEQAHQTYNDAAAALRFVLSSHQGSDNLELANAARQLIEAIAPFNDVRIRLGNLLLTKTTVDNRSNLIIEVLSQQQVDHFEGRSSPSNTGRVEVDSSCRSDISKQMSVAPPTPIEVFISYSHNDEELKRELTKHLSLLNREHLISEWHDRDITAGTEWRLEIDRHLNTARLILILVSPDYMASEYCYGIEMTRALQRHYNGSAVVIPIILRPVDWHSAPFAKLQALPIDAQPITTWVNRDVAFANTALGIRNAIELLNANSRA